VGGIALCQVAVTLTYATGRGHALIGRALYLPEGCAADEEHRELAGVPEQVMFATKPQLAGAVLERAHSRGIRAAFVAGDEVYGGRELRRYIRQRGMGYVMAVRRQPRPYYGLRPHGDRRRCRQHDSRSRLAPDAHRFRNQGHALAVLQTRLPESQQHPVDAADLQRHVTGQDLRGRTG
jgi:hypothetical protein